MEKLLERLRSKGVWRLDMASGEALTVDRPMTLEISGGRAWITVEGEPDDWFLGDGQRFVTPAGRQTVIQADGACTLVMGAGSLRPAGETAARHVANAVASLRIAVLRSLPASFVSDVAGNLRSGLALLRA